ncbi:conserved hypothetical protein [Crenothrix polyspora]|jgi:hypothetical protein|uniref:Uncharacterized protein n=1 Tax=Crenothrix polyspora TaxID=360316 RepID=A0A1R4H6Z9_9GAMM|nr:hypothetical protein [Crenothrix polyspora]SJM92032.1 conserved hypothetical protein [Crenothrix polyspora]
MHELIEGELYQALEYAKSIDQHQGQRIIIQFEIDQPLLSQTIFNAFPSMIAEHSEELSHFFMDLCFELICVYQKAFGSTPRFKDDPTWMERQALSFDEILQPMAGKKRIDAKQSNKMKQRFYQPKEGEIIQNGLVQFLNDSIDDDAEGNSYSKPAIELTKAMLFVTVRLFNNLYSDSTIKH